MSTHADTAAELVLGERNRAYGDPDKNLGATAMCLNGYLNACQGRNLDGRDMAWIMLMLKGCRDAYFRKDDNLVDAHGYLLCAEWITKGERPTPLSDKLQSSISDYADALESVCVGERLTNPDGSLIK